MSDGSREDWLVVATSTLCIAAALIHVNSMGVFILPIEREFGWSRGQITSGMTIVSVVSVVCAPFIGMAIDRFGSRRIALPGLALYGAAIMALATINESVGWWWALWLFVAAGSILVKATVWVAAVATRFERRRGIALALALCGSGIGAAIIPTIATLLIDRYGWRGAYLGLGAGGLIITLIPALLFFRDAVDARKTTKARDDLPGMAIGPSIRSFTFIRLALATLLAMTSIMALSVHFVPVLVARSFTPKDAAAIAGVIGIAAIVGRLVTGLLLDRLNGPLVGAFALGLPVLACMLLIGSGGSTISAIAVAALFGLSLGAETDVVAYLTARFFGLRHYGMLFGTLAGLLSLGTGLGPMLAGMLYDRFGSYDPLLWMLMPAFATSALLIGTMGRYPDFGSAEAKSR